MLCSGTESCGTIHFALWRLVPVLVLFVCALACRGVNTFLGSTWQGLLALEGLRTADRHSRLPVPRGVGSMASILQPSNHLGNVAVGVPVLRSGRGGGFQWERKTGARGRRDRGRMAGGRDRGRRAGRGNKLGSLRWGRAAGVQVPLRLYAIVGTAIQLPHCMTKRGEHRA